MFTWLILTALSACLPCGVATAKLSGQTVILRSSIFAVTSIPRSRSIRILSGKVPSAMKHRNTPGLASY
jgi:hypothetical protein